MEVNIFVLILTFVIEILNCDGNVACRLGCVATREQPCLEMVSLLCKFMWVVQVSD